MFAIRRTMFESIGGFSEAVPHNHTDVEYSYYVESCGWQLGQIPGLIVIYQKSRPLLTSRLDESVYAVHPGSFALKLLCSTQSFGGKRISATPATTRFRSRTIRSSLVRSAARRPSIAASTVTSPNRLLPTDNSSPYTSGKQIGFCPIGKKCSVVARSITLGSSPS